ncbi:MAG: winged helix-turn-helix transcriptional regulator [Candidatus Thermoplasmatota archaeon]|nr:winged helix-turn-helix transcriptional regulator [Candidatus Thermoplasmatota archaeon]
MRNMAGLAKRIVIGGIKAVALFIVFSFLFLATSTAVEYASYKANEAADVGDGILVQVPYSRMGDTASYSLSFKNYTYKNPVYKKELYRIHFGESLINENIADAFGFREPLLRIDESFNYSLSGSDSFPSDFFTAFDDNYYISYRNTTYYLNGSGYLAQRNREDVYSTNSDGIKPEVMERQYDYGYGLGGWEWAMWGQGCNFSYNLSAEEYLEYDIAGSYKVDNCKIINGYVCVSETEEYDYRLDHENQFCSDNPFTTYFVRYEGEAKGVHEEVKIWRSSGSPYIILKETNVTVTNAAGNIIDEIYTQLVFNEINVGSVLVPWANSKFGWMPPQMDGNGLINQDLDWQPMFMEIAPQDGEGCELAYLLSEVITNILNDPLIGFSEYLASHPGAYLQSAYYNRFEDNDYLQRYGLLLGTTGEQETETHSWHLIFSDEGGSGYSAFSNKTILKAIPELVLAVENSEEYPFSAIPMQAPITSGKAPTIQSAIEVWRRDASDYFSNMNVTLLTWGVEDFWLYDSYARNPNFPWRELFCFSSVCIGYYYNGWEVEQSLLSQNTTYTSRVEESCIKINASNGKTNTLGEYQIVYQPDLSSDPSNPYGGTQVSGTQSKQNGEYYVPAESSYPPSWFRLSIQSIEKTAIGFSIVGALAVIVYFTSSLKYGISKMFFFPLFSKTLKDNALTHRTRSRIFKIIQSESGANISDIMKKADIAWGEAVHHLDVLESGGYVMSMKRGRSRRYFIKEGTQDYAAREISVVMRNRTAELIYNSIKRTPGINQRQLAEIAGIKHPAAIWHIKQLKGVGLVEERKEGRYTKYFPASAAGSTFGNN